MWQLYFESIALVTTIALAGWVYSVYKNNVTVVDSLWAMMFLFAGGYVFIMTTQSSFKNTLLIFLLAIWAIRLSVFLHFRNHNKPEDRRYQKIRNNHSPGFAFRSLYIIFLLQAGIASIIFSGLLPGLYYPQTFSLTDIVGLVIWLSGFSIESIADMQLYRFKQNSKNQRSVMTSGLWRYSRHPNYFGEFLVWWGFYLMLAQENPAWIIISPLLITILLLKVSGVSLMENGINERRPAYRAYQLATPAFFPRIPAHEHKHSGKHKS